MQICVVWHMKYIKGTLHVALVLPLIALLVILECLIVVKDYMWPVTKRTIFRTPECIRDSWNRHVHPR